MLSDKLLTAASSPNLVPTNITYIGTASGTTSATLPAHQAGDLLICSAVAFDSGLVPTQVIIPSMPSGWTSLVSGGTGKNLGDGTYISAGQRAAYKVATSNSEVSGTWSSADGMCIMVLRGQNVVDPIGKLALGVNLRENTYNQYRIDGDQEVNDGSSLIISFVISDNQTLSLDAPFRLTRNHIQNRGSTRIAAFNSPNGIRNWNQTYQVSESTSNFMARTVSFEIKSS